MSAGQALGSINWAQTSRSSKAPAEKPKPWRSGQQQAETSHPFTSSHTESSPMQDESCMGLGPSPDPEPTTGQSFISR